MTYKIMKKENPQDKHWQVLILILKNIAKEKAITHDVIAEKTGIARANISRFFSLKHSPSLKMFIKVARAIEVNFFIEDKEEKTNLSIMFEKAMTELGRRANDFKKLN